MAMVKVDYEDEDENDWISYLHRNLAHRREIDCPFPDSGWSYAHHDSVFEQDGGFLKKSDEVIRESSCEALYQSPGVDASDIEVIVLNGTVYLSGSVFTPYQRQEAKRAIEVLPGVWDVRLGLKILH